MRISHGRALAKDSFFYSLPKVLPALGQVLLIPVFTAFLSPDDYGVLALLAAAGQMLAIVMSLNMNTGVLRFYHDFVGSARRRFLGTVAVGSLIYTGVICAVLLFWGRPVFNAVFREAQIPFYPMVAAQILIVFFSAAVLVPGSVLKNERKAKEWSYLQIGSWLIVTALSIYFIAFLNDGAWGKIKAQLIGSALLFVMYWRITLKNSEISFEPKVFNDNLVFGLPILGKSFSTYAYQFSDRWIMAQSLPMGHIGMFSLGDSFSRLIQMVQMSFGDAWMPYFYGEAKRSPESVSAMTRDISCYWTIMMVACTLAFCVFIEPLVLCLAAPQFHDPIVVNSAKLLAVACFLGSLQIFPIYALSYSKKNVPILTTTVIAAGLNITVNIIFIPIFGVLVAGWGRIMAQALNLFLIYKAAQKVFPVSYNTRAASMALLLGVVGYFISYFSNTGILLLDSIKNLIIYILFIISLFLTNLLEYQEVVVFLRGVFNRVSSRL